jgi:hypothetical protein
VPNVPLWDGNAAERIVHVLERTIADPLEPRLAG